MTPRKTQWVMMARTSWDLGAELNAYFSQFLLKAPLRGMRRVNSVFTLGPLALTTLAAGVEEML